MVEHGISLLWELPLYQDHSQAFLWESVLFFFDSD